MSNRMDKRVAPVVRVGDECGKVDPLSIGTNPQRQPHGPAHHHSAVVLADKRTQRIDDELPWYQRLTSAVTKGGRQTSPGRPNTRLPDRVT